jgi:hypothetical protein
MNEVIKSIGYTDFWRTILRAAYNFSTDENDFIDGIWFQYYKFQMNEYGTSRSEFYPIDTVKFIKDNYSKIKFTRYSEGYLYMNILGMSTTMWLICW